MSNLISKGIALFNSCMAQLVDYGMAGSSQHDTPVPPPVITYKLDFSDSNNSMYVAVIF